MMRILSSTLQVLSLSAALLLFPAAGRAVDTEIYFNEIIGTQVAGETVQGNVLFILDASGSMDRLTGDGTATQRIDALKDSLDTLLQESRNLRVGLMQLNERQGGSVLFPVQVTLDESVSTIASESGDALVTSTINASEDDTLQIGSNVFDDRVSAPLGSYATGWFAVSSALFQRVRPSELLVAPAPDAAERAQFTETFSIGAEDTIGQGPHRAGIYFQGLDIPQGATISYAALQFTRSAEGSASFGDAPAAPTITISAVDARPLDPSDPNAMFARTTVGAARILDDDDASAGTDSFDIEDLLQEVVNRADWTAGDALFLILQSAQTHRQLRYRDRRATSISALPDLQILWNITPALTAAPAPQQHVAGLRFTGIDIPQGATISNVSLNLGVLGEVSAQSTQWDIHAEAADNAGAFTTGDNDLSNRTRTAARARWTVPANRNDAVHRVCLNSSCTGTLRAVLQEVVNRAGWCGGNDINLIIRASGTGNRRLLFREGGRQTTATMNISHTGSMGCTTGANTLTPRSANDVGLVTSDGVFRSSGWRALLGSGRLTGFGSVTGAGGIIRFPNITIPQGSTITDARLTVTRSRRFTRVMYPLRIRAVDADAMPPLTDNATLSGTAFTTATGRLNLPAVSSAEVFQSVAVTSEDLSAVISEVVGRTGWSPGNALVLYIDTTSSVADRGGRDEMDRYTGFGSSDAPVLRIDFRTTARLAVVNTARARLRGYVNGLVAEGDTPIISTLYEAALYWRGENARWGRIRHNRITGQDPFRTAGETNRLSHPGSYCSLSADRLTTTCTGTTIDSDTDNHGVEFPAGCSADNLANASCVDQEIKGAPEYLSPFLLPASLCAGSHQVLLSDGAIAEIAYLQTDGNAARTTLGLPACVGGPCAEAVARNLNTVDQISTQTGRQTVTTHTIAFALNDPDGTEQMRDIAAAGGGRFYEAAGAAELLETFRIITATIISGAGSSVAAPSISTNSFNRLRSRDKIYFGMFDPDRLVSWEGNVRNYNICVDSSCVDTATGIGLGDLYDQNNMPVTDPDTGRFLLGSTSLWATASDGSGVTEGGAGDEDDSSSARIYTELRSDGTLAPANTLLSAAEYQLTLTNWSGSTAAHIRDAVCGTRTETTDDSECGQLMRWWLGAGAATGSDDRWAFHDVLHSSPVSITYNGNRTANTFVDRLLVGTNDGALRFINADDGTTQWRFYPNSTLPNLRTLFINAALPHEYGFDLTPTLQINDADSDGVIEPADGDFVRAFIGQRRGGTQLYALDLTPSAILTGASTVTPRVLWRISSASTGFVRLGQTWSQPAVARVATSTGAREVLIFGGGYDDTLDDKFNTGEFFGGVRASQGNAIYIVDPSDGSLVLSITGSAPFCPNCDGDIQHFAMSYPIPGRVAVLDSNGDGLDDRLYVGDTGGQVWRVDLAPNIGASGARAGDTLVARLANISTSGTAADERKFFERPSVVQVRDTTYSNIAGGEYDYVLIGSGDRPNPLSDTVTDRFYGFRDAAIGGLPDADGNNISQLSDGHIPITESNLVDVTSTTLDATDATHTAARGWYVTLSGDGEKVYSSPTVISGAVLFTSYEPVDVGAECGINIGGGSAYNIDILTTKAAIDWDEDGTLEATQDRSKALGAGIPSSVLPLFTDEGVVGIVGIEGGAVTIGTLAALPRARTYWYQDTN